jgi:HlyD family secretion protein
MSALFCLLISVVIVSCGDNNIAPGGSGLIEATEATVSVETGGKILQLYFEEGNAIKADDSIAMIDTLNISLLLRKTKAVYEAARIKSETSSLTVEQAEHNLTLAKKEYDRIVSLLQSGSANQQQYDQLENGYIQAQLNLKQAKAAKIAAEADIARINAEIAILQKQFNDCFPKAPFSGFVVEKFIDPGELIGIGQGLVKIARLDTVWVKIYLPPADLTNIKLGNKAEINPEDGSGKSLVGYISWISPEAEFTPKNIQTKEARADLVYAVKIIIPNENLRLKIGMPVSVTIQ